MKTPALTMSRLLRDMRRSNLSTAAACTLWRSSSDDDSDAADPAGIKQAATLVAEGRAWMARLHQPPGIVTSRPWLDLPWRQGSCYPMLFAALSAAYEAQCRIVQILQALGSCPECTASEGHYIGCDLGDYLCESGTCPEEAEMVYE